MGADGADEADEADEADLCIERCTDRRLLLTTMTRDEYSGRLPWDLFGEEEAKSALALAEKIVQQVQSLIEEVRHA